MIFNKPSNTEKTHSVTVEYSDVETRLVEQGVGRDSLKTTLVHRMLSSGSFYAVEQKYDTKAKDYDFVEMRPLAVEDAASLIDVATAVDEKAMFLAGYVHQSNAAAYVFHGMMIDKIVHDNLVVEATDEAGVAPYITISGNLNDELVDAINVKAKENTYSSAAKDVQKFIYQSSRNIAYESPHNANMATKNQQIREVSELMYARFCEYLQVLEATVPYENLAESANTIAGEACLNSQYAQSEIVIPNVDGVEEAETSSLSQDIQQLVDRAWNLSVGAVVVAPEVKSMARQTLREVYKGNELGVDKVTPILAAGVTESGVEATQ